MESRLVVYNTLTRQKERFEPLHAPSVGMYVCGPTVYGDPHLGHARPAITFDVVFRYLRHLGYKVRYVRNYSSSMRNSGLPHFMQKGSFTKGSRSAFSTTAR